MKISENEQSILEQAARILENAEYQLEKEAREAELDGAVVQTRYLLEKSNEAGRAAHTATKIAKHSQIV